jgi:hypothetical protein
MKPLLLEPASSLARRSGGWPWCGHDPALAAKLATCGYKIFETLQAGRRLGMISVPGG